MPPFVRSPYNYDVKAASDSAMSIPEGESLTVQSQAEDADINVMMKRFGITGKFPDPPPRLPQYGDFTRITDFRGAWEACSKAADLFMKYPADFRAKFDNDPQNFLEFTANPANIPEMRQLGLFKELPNVSGSTGGGSPPSSNAPSPQGGAGAQVGNAGNGFPQPAAQPGSGQPGGKT